MLLGMLAFYVPLNLIEDVYRQQVLERLCALLLCDETLCTVTGSDRLVLEHHALPISGNRIRFLFRETSTIFVFAKLERTRFGIHGDELARFE